MTEQVHYLRHRICVHPLIKKNGDYVTNHYSCHELKVFDYPAEIIRRRYWLVNLWAAKMQVRFPRHHIRIHVAGYYWPELDDETIKKRRIAAAKGKVSKIKRLIEERIKEMSTTLWQDYDSDPFIILARQKLEEAEFKLSQMTINL